MKKKKPIFFDENRPFAHYEAAGKVKKEADAAITFGKIFPLVVLPVGIVCIAFEPFFMALFALFGILFTVLAIIGCSLRHIGYILISVLLAFITAVVLYLSGSDFSALGAVLYVAAGISHCKVLASILNLNMLKELPGFPFFDPAMDDISFAAMEYHGGDEFIEGELVEERTERAKIVPIEPPSEEMCEIVAEDIPAEEYDFEKGCGEDKKSNYEQMINAQTPDSSNISDIDLFC